MSRAGDSGRMDAAARGWQSRPLMSRSRRTRPGTPSGDYLRQLAEMGRDPGAWTRLDTDELLLMAFQQALYLGSGESEAGTGLSGLYAEVVGRVTPEQRHDLLDRVQEAVESGSTSVLALMPFLQHEPDAAIVQSAALAFAAHMPLAEGDPMTGPRTIAALVPHADDDEVRVGLLAGLLALGDRRVLPVLRGLWRHLEPAGRESLTRQSLPFACASTVEFLLDWLEDADDEGFGVAAAMLARLPADGGGRVLDLQRRFPAHVDTGEPEIEVVGEWSAAEYGARIAPRLADLERRENEPRVLPAVRAAWGVA